MVSNKYHGYKNKIRLISWSGKFKRKRNHKEIIDGWIDESQWQWKQRQHTEIFFFLFHQSVCRFRFVVSKLFSSRVLTQTDSLDTIAAFTAVYYTVVFTTLILHTYTPLLIIIIINITLESIHIQRELFVPLLFQQLWSHIHTHTHE